MFQKQRKAFYLSYQTSVFMPFLLFHSINIMSSGMQWYRPVIFLKQVQVPVFSFSLNQVIRKTSHKQKRDSQGLEEEASTANMN